MALKKEPIKWIKLPRSEDLKTTDFSELVGAEGKF